MDDTLTLTVGSKVVQVGDMLGVAVVRWAARKGTAQHEHRADTAHSTLLKRSAVSSQSICWVRCAGFGSLSSLGMKNKQKPEKICRI